MIDSGFPIKIGSTPVDTATTDVNEPLPGNNPRSVGMAMSPFVEINVAPLRTARQAFANFSYVMSRSKPTTTKSGFSSTSSNPFPQAHHVSLLHQSYIQLRLVYVRK